MSVIGAAGWSVSSARADRFAAKGSALQRYASALDGVEINSSFYRRHKAETWQRWADSVSDNFRFAVKLPRTVSHKLRLVDAEDALAVLPPILRRWAISSGRCCCKCRQRWDLTRRS